MKSSLLNIDIAHFSQEIRDSLESDGHLSDLAKEWLESYGDEPLQSEKPSLESHFKDLPTPRALELELGYHLRVVQALPHLEESAVLSMLLVCRRRGLPSDPYGWAHLILTLVKRGTWSSLKDLEGRFVFWMELDGGHALRALAAYWHNDSLEALEEKILKERLHLLPKSLLRSGVFRLFERDVSSSLLVRVICLLMESLGKGQFILEGNDHLHIELFLDQKMEREGEKGIVHLLHLLAKWKTRTPETRRILTENLFLLENEVKVGYCRSFEQIPEKILEDIDQKHKSLEVHRLKAGLRLLLYLCENQIMDDAKLWKEGELVESPVLEKIAGYFYSHRGRIDLDNLDRFGLSVSRPKELLDAQRKAIYCGYRWPFLLEGHGLNALELFLKSGMTKHRAKVLDVLQSWTPIKEGCDYHVWEKRRDLVEMIPEDPERCSLFIYVLEKIFYEHPILMHPIIMNKLLEKNGLQDILDFAEEIRAGQGVLDKIHQGYVQFIKRGNGFQFGSEIFLNAIHSILIYPWIDKGERPDVLRLTATLCLASMTDMTEEEVHPGGHPALMVFLEKAKILGLKELLSRLMERGWWPLDGLEEDRPFWFLDWIQDGKEKGSEEILEFWKELGPSLRAFFNIETFREWRDDSGLLGDVRRLHLNVLHGRDGEVDRRSPHYPRIVLSILGKSGKNTMELHQDILDFPEGVGEDTLNEVPNDPIDLELFPNLEKKVPQCSGVGLQRWRQAWELSEKLANKELYGSKEITLSLGRFISGPLSDLRKQVRTRRHRSSRQHAEMWLKLFEVILPRFPQSSGALLAMMASLEKGMEDLLPYALAWLISEKKKLDAIGEESRGMELQDKGLRVEAIRKMIVEGFHEEIDMGISCVWASEEPPLPILLKALQGSRVGKGILKLKGWETRRQALLKRMVESLLKYLRLSMGSDFRGKPMEKQSLSLRLQATRRPLDLAYGRVGEICLNPKPEDIMQPNFIHFRMLDMDKRRWVGSILTIKTNWKEGEALLICGIEPSSQMMEKLDPIFFWESLQKHLLEVAKRMGMIALLQTLNPTAISNRVELREVIQSEMNKKEDLFLDEKVYFPGTQYDVSKVCCLWERD